MMASTHKHHIVPRSKGGPDEEWNFVSLSPYDHAYEHALDFVLFDHAPMFDFRHEAWPLLPEDLKEAVLAKRSSWAKEFFTGKPRSDEVRRKISISKTGIPNSATAKRKMSEAKKGRKREPWETVSGGKHGASKRVRVICPDGTVKEFSCMKEVCEELGCARQNLRAWVKENRTPRSGKLVGYLFQFID
jgi:hypothetical protein